MVTKTTKPLEYTAKGTPRRQVCIASYADEIDALYKRVEESSQIDLPPPRDWASETVHEYIGAVVRKVMKNESIKDNDDLFQQGCDRYVWLGQFRHSLLLTLPSQSSGDLDPQHYHPRAPLCLQCEHPRHPLYLRLRQSHH